MCVVCAYRLYLFRLVVLISDGLFAEVVTLTGLVGGGVRWCGFGSAKYCAIWARGSRGEKGEKRKPQTQSGLLEGKKDRRRNLVARETMRKLA